MSWELKKISLSQRIWIILLPLSSWQKSTNPFTVHRASILTMPINGQNKIEELIKKNLSIKKVVAVGEIGLDYHYEHSPKDIQRRFLKNSWSLQMLPICPWLFTQEMPMRI